MEVFTYNDYITCIHTLRLNSVSKLAEESEKYNLEINTRRKKTNNIHNEIIRGILKNKSEVAEVINDFVDNNERIRGKDLEKCFNIKYSLDGNLVYKLKDKDVFFLIRHQQEIDNSILYEVLNYCVEIIYDWNMAIKIKAGIKYPIVAPIIIYTGIKKWNIICDFSDLQVNDYRFEDRIVDFKYNLIDINKLSIESLIQKNSLFSYAMALGKTRNHEQFINILNKELISSNGKKVLQRKLFSNLLRGLENEGKEISNLGTLDEISKEDEKVKAIKRELIKFLIKEHTPEEEMLKFISITKSELEELKKELQ